MRPSGSWVNLGCMTAFPLALAAYLVLICTVAAFAFLRVRSAADYWLAGRRSSGLATGGSLAATIVGGSSTLGLAGLAFQRGLTGSWWLLVGPIGLSLLLFFLRSLRSRIVYTLPELIGGWYGPVMRKLAGIFILVAWMGIVGAQARAAGSILCTFLGGDPLIWTAAGGAVFVLYTAAGGQISVIRTDLFQALLIFLGIGCSALIGLRLIGGLAGLRSTLPPVMFSFPVSPSFSLFDLALLVLVVGSTYLIGPDMLSRIFCSGSERAARRGVLISIAIIVPVTLLVTACGLISRALFPEAAPEAALPLLAGRALPPWLGALLLIALLSAFLSSADTTLLTMSAIISVDFLHQGATDRLLVPRLTVVFCGAAAVLVGIFSGGIIPSLLLGYSVFSGGLFVPILAGLLGRPLRRPAALAAACLGGLTALAGKLAGSDILVAVSFFLGFAILLGDRLLSARDRTRVQGTAL